MCARIHVCFEFVATRKIAMAAALKGNATTPQCGSVHCFWRMLSAVFFVAAFCLIGCAVGSAVTVTYYSGAPSVGCVTKVDNNFLDLQCGAGSANPLIAPLTTCMKLCTAQSVGVVYIKGNTCTSQTLNFGIFKDSACTAQIPNSATTILLDTCGQAFYGSMSMKLTCSNSSAASVSIAVVAAVLFLFL
jgi:hypothetical protein